MPYMLLCVHARLGMNTAIITLLPRPVPMPLENSGVLSALHGYLWLVMQTVLASLDSCCLPPLGLIPLLQFGTLEVSGLYALHVVGLLVLQEPVSLTEADFTLPC
jgi:hypothetical protein